MLAKYRKFILAAVAAAIIGIQAALSDGSITADEWWKVLIAAAGAIGVVIVPNEPNTTDTPKRVI